MGGDVFLRKNLSLLFQFPDFWQRIYRNRITELENIVEKEGGRESRMQLAEKRFQELGAYVEEKKRVISHSGSRREKFMKHRGVRWSK